MIETGPDIIFSIIIVARFTKNASYSHIKAVKIIFCYLKGLIDYSIIYDSNRKNFFIKSYLESN